MTRNATGQPDRRTALTAGVRYGAAGLLAAFGIGAIAKRRRLYDGRCVNRSVCRDCRLFERCGLPLALSSKRAITGKMPVPQALTGKMPVPQALTGKMPVPQALTGKMPVPQALAGKMPAPREEGHRG